MALYFCAAVAERESRCHDIVWLRKMAHSGSSEPLFGRSCHLRCLPCTQMLKIGLVTRGSVERTPNGSRIPPVPHPAPTSGPVWPSDFLPICGESLLLSCRIASVDSLRCLVRDSELKCVIQIVAPPKPFKLSVLHDIVL